MHASCNTSKSVCTLHPEKKEEEEEEKKKPYAKL
jgi:hypothetical protein